MVETLRSKKALIFAAVVAVVAVLLLVNVSSEGQNTAPVAKSKASAVTGAAPLKVVFVGDESSDPDGDALTYAWEFGDGTKATSVNSTKLYERSGKYTVVLKVSDGKETVAAKPIVITVGEAVVQGASTEASNTQSVSKNRVLAAATTTPTQVVPAVTQPTPTTPAVVTPNPNLILNASFVDPYSADIPLHWIEGSYGVNVVDFSYEATGRTDSSSVSIAVSNYVFGDAKWIFEPVAIEGGKTYKFKDWYKSDVQTEVLADYTLDDSSHQYELVAVVPPATDWTEYSQTLVTPDNAVEVSVQHMIKFDGTLQLDDYSLVEQ